MPCRRPEPPGVSHESHPTRSRPCQHQYPRPRSGRSLAQSTNGIGSSLIEGTEDYGIASDADIFGCPLITMEMTRRVMTKVAAAQGSRGPMGTLIKLRQYPDASFTDVTVPKADTLYTTAWIDVGDEPWLLDQPDMGDRDFLPPMHSGWTDLFQVPRSRTTGGAAKSFLITGPGWTGTVPEGMTQLKSPTAMVWFLGRIDGTGTPQGLRRRPKAAGCLQAPAAVHLGHRLHAARRQGRSLHRHEDLDPRPGERALRDRRFHPAARPDEAQSVRGRRQARDGSLRASTATRWSSPRDRPRRSRASGR